MDIKSIIKNVLAQRLEENVQVPQLPKVKDTNDYVKYLAEAIQYRLDELKINKDINRAEVKRMKTAGVSKGARREFTKDDVSRAEKDKEIKTAQRGTTKGPSNRERGYERGTTSPKAGIAKANAEGKAQTPPLSKDQINKMGVGGKKNAAGQSKEKNLNRKLRKISANTGKLLGSLADKEGGSGRNPKNKGGGL